MQNETPNQADRSSDPGGFPRFGWPLLVLFFSVSPYLGKLANTFLVWDDQRFILRNEAIQSLGNASQFFTQGVDGLYRPLRSLLYALCYALFENNAIGYQVVGIALHAGCALAFFWMLRKAAFSPLTSTIAAVIFAAHPIHVERVAGITASFDNLGDGLLLASIALYLDGWTEGVPRWRRFCWVATLLPALFTSEMALVFFPIVLCFEFARSASIPKVLRSEALVRYLVALIAIGLYLAARFAVLKDLGRGVARPAEGFVYNLLTVATIHLTYLRSFVDLGSLNYFYDIRIAQPGDTLVGIAALIVHATLMGTALFGVGRWPKISLGVMWFYVMLLPFSQILPNQPIFQERYAYLAVGAFAFVLATGYVRASRRTTGRTAKLFLAGLGVIYIACLSLITAGRVGLYKNDLTLWRATEQRAPNHAGAVLNHGVALFNLGRCEQALPYFQKAERLGPQFTLAPRRLADGLACLGRYDEASQALFRYLRLAPGDFSAEDLGYRYAIAANNADQVIQRIESKQKAGGVRPLFLLTLAMAYKQAGDLTQSERIVRHYLSVKPGDRTAEALLNMLKAEKEPDDPMM